MSAYAGHGGACVTCGDVAVAAVVVSVDGTTALVQAGGGVEQVAADLVAPLAPGDTVLCHAGVALALIETEPATSTEPTGPAGQVQTGQVQSGAPLGHPGPPPAADSIVATDTCPSQVRDDSVEAAARP